MIKKMLISYLIISCLLLISVFSVIAIDEAKTIADDEDDVLVFDLTSEEEEEKYTDDRANDDIIEVKYDRTGKQVTLDIICKCRWSN